MYSEYHEKEIRLFFLRQNIIVAEEKKKKL